MFHYLDLTLQELLKRRLPKFLGDPLEVSFQAPDTEFASKAAQTKIPIVDLFLYDVRENRELRTVEPWIERTPDGKAEIKPAPVRIDCSYLITAWSNEDKTGALEQHELLGEVTKVLLSYPTLPQEVLHDELRSQELPLPTTTLQPGRLQSLGEFWQALGGKPRAALNYQVTLAMPVFQAKTVPVVLEKQLRQGQMEPGERS
jgi:hypothetical protein